MEDLNKLIVGMNQDVHEANQPENTTREVRNFVVMDTGGNQASITNEQGTLLVQDVSFPTGFKVMGYYVLNNEIIVVLVDGEGNSQVGVIKETITAVYEAVAPVDPITGEVSSTNSEFGFSQNHPIDCEARKLITGERILYFTDNNIPFGRVNLDNPPEVGTVRKNTSLLPNASHAKITFVGIDELGASTVVPGVYHFATRYVTRNGGITEVGNITDPIPIIPTSRDANVNIQHGGYPEDGPTTKRIVIDITDIDQEYNELEIIVISYSAEGEASANVVAQLPINSESQQFIYSGLDDEIDISVPLAEISALPVSYDRAKCIEQLDNVLYLSNLNDSSTDNNDILQQVANKVRVGYQIDEIQYSGRGNETTTDAVFGYIEAISTEDTVAVFFNKTITQAQIGSITLVTVGGNARGFITIDDNNNINTNDTITIDAFGSQLEVEITVKNNPGVNEFVVGATAADTVINIAEAINNHSDNTLMTATVQQEQVTITWDVFDATVNVPITSENGITASPIDGATEVEIEYQPITHSVFDDKIVLTFPAVKPTDRLRIANIQAGDEVFTSIVTLPIQEADINEEPSVFQTGRTDYVNEEVHYAKKTYRRNEVYSLAFALRYNNNSVSSAYHIPGFSGFMGAGIGKFPDPSWTTFNEGDTFGNLGTYVSLQDYPNGQLYPGVNTGDDNGFYGGTTQPVAGLNGVANTRHHLIPSSKNEPHYRVDGNVVWLRPMSLTFNFTELIPNDILEQVSEIIILRERRNKNENKSVLSQGFINRGIVTADNFDKEGEVGDGTVPGGTIVENPKDGYYVTEMPYFDNLTSAIIEGKDLAGEDDDGDNTADDIANARAGLVYPNLTGGYVDGSYQDGRKQNSDILNKRAYFHSPEVELNTPFRLDKDDLGGAFITPILKLKGDYTQRDSGKTEYYSDLDDDYVREYGFSDISSKFINYFTSVNSTVNKIITGRFSIYGEHRLEPLDDLEPSLKTSTRWTTGGLELVLEDDLPDTESSLFKLKTDIQFQYWSPVDIIDRLTDGLGRWANDGDTATERATRKIAVAAAIITLGPAIALGIGTIMATVNTIGLFGNVSASLVSQTKETGEVETGINGTELIRDLYSIENNNEIQYGLVSSAAYMAISTIPVDGFNGVVEGVYNGDTFISNYSYNGGQLIHHLPMGLSRRKGTHTAYKVLPARGFDHTDGIEPIGGRENIRAWGFDMRWGTSYFVESSINTYYRHKDEDDLKKDYFPNTTDWTSILNSFNPFQGNSQEYNIQYSYENNIREYYPRTSTEIESLSFENRTIYSERASEDDTVDTYRSFLSNAYYDLPTHTGPIWDSFVQFNTLYLHTPKCLWRTYANYTPTLQGDSSDVILGTTSNFTRPSIQTYTDEGGYGGTISQFGGIHTPIGYVYLDSLQGKVFLLGASETGLQLKEISLDGMQTFFRENALPDSFDNSLITTNTAHMIDNPFMRSDVQLGITGGYDHTLKRFILAMNNHTISFSLLSNTWASFHDYTPNVIIPLNKKMYFTRNVNTNNDLITADFWEMNEGERGDYFNEKFDSQLEIISNENIGTKVFTNLVIVSDTFTDDGQNIKIKDDCFTGIQITNDRNNTGLQEIVQASNEFAHVVNAGEVSCKYRNDEYRLALPRDMVIDNSLSLVDADNLYTPVGNVSEDFSIKKKIKGDYAKIKLIYNNSISKEFVINYIKTIFNKNAR